jgi:hypothetical protein
MSVNPRLILRKYVPLAWLLQKEPVTAPIIGATRISHLEDAVGALKVKLTPDEIQRLEEAYQPHPGIGFSYVRAVCFVSGEYAMAAEVYRFSLGLSVRFLWQFHPNIRPLFILFIRYYRNCFANINPQPETKLGSIKENLDGAIC